MKNNLLSLNQRKTLSLFDSQENLSVQAVGQNLGISRATAKQILNRLNTLGLVDRYGLGRGTFYSLKSENEILDTSGQKLVTVHKGIDSFRELFDNLKKQLGKDDFYWSFAFRNEYSGSAVRNILTNFHRDLTQKGVDDRSIVHRDIEHVVREAYRHVPELKLRFTDRDIPVGTIVIQDAVIFLIWGENPLAITIKALYIVKRYKEIFSSIWEQSIDCTDEITNEIPKPGNTPLIKLEGIHGVTNLFMKDETQNPTHTFKDRLAYEMIRPLFEQIRAGKSPTQTTFGSISYGNTARSMGYYVNLLNKVWGSEVAKAVAFVPPSLKKKQFGPDTEGRVLAAGKVISEINKTCNIVSIDLKKMLYRSKDLEDLALENNALQGEFVDITEGLSRPAYVNIIIETIEQQLQGIPDYVIVPFGAGILCNEIIDYINEHKLHTKVIPVSSGNPDTIAVMLYGPIWVDTVTLEKTGKAYTRHEPIDRKGRKRDPYVVYNVKDSDLRKTMNILAKNNISAEPSGASGFAILPYLNKIDPDFDPKKHSVLVINTGNGLLNYE